jgi:hypothetical protein
MKDPPKSLKNISGMGVWQRVAMNSLKFHPGLPCPTFLRPAPGCKVVSEVTTGPTFTPLDTPRRMPMISVDELTTNICFLSSNTNQKRKSLISQVNSSDKRNEDEKPPDIIC